MKRDIIQVFNEWKNRKIRKPLIVRGARQVGKTYAIEEFAKKEFENYIEINLEEHTELKKLFEKPNVNAIINELSVFFNTDIIEGKTLLFIDEIQTSPEAILSLRYFKEHKPNLHVIAAGSLLDHTLNEMNYSMPVGRVEFCYMYPMSFKEFLLALSEKRLVEYVDSYVFGNEFSNLLHDKITDYLRYYFFIGGMPEAVKSFVENKNLINIERIHSNILTSLQYDFAKYGKRKQQEYLLKVLKYSAFNIGKKVKYSNIDRDIRSVYLKEAFKKLELSRIIHLIKHTNSGHVPLSNYVKDEIYKPLFLDIGLANHLSNIQLIDIKKLTAHNEGALAEQFIGQELLASSKSYIDTNLYYWNREKKNSNAEIDYLYQYNNKIFPIEVKAGKSGSLKSLHQFLHEKKLTKGIRFNINTPTIGTFSTKIISDKYREELNYNLISLPLYMAYRLNSLLSKI